MPVCVLAGVCHGPLAAVSHPCGGARLTLFTLFLLSVHTGVVSLGVPQNNSVTAPRVMYIPAADAHTIKTNPDSRDATSGPERPFNGVAHRETKDGKNDAAHFSEPNSAASRRPEKARVRQAQASARTALAVANGLAERSGRDQFQSNSPQTRVAEEEQTRSFKGDGQQIPLPGDMAAGKEILQRPGNRRAPVESLPARTLAVVGAKRKETTPPGKLERAKSRAPEASGAAPVSKISTGISELTPAAAVSPEGEEGGGRRSTEANELRALEKELFRRFEVAEEKAISLSPRFKSILEGRGGAWYKLLSSLRPIHGLDGLYEQHPGARYEYLLRLRPGRPGVFRAAHLLTFLGVLAISRPESWNYMYLLVGWAWVAFAFLALWLYSSKRDKAFMSIANELKSRKWFYKSLDQKKAAQLLFMRAVFEEEKPRIAGLSAVGAGLSFLLLPLFIGRKRGVGPVVHGTPHVLVSMDPYFPQVMAVILLLYGVTRFLKSLAARRRYAKILGNEREQRKTRVKRRGQSEEGDSENQHGNGEAVLRHYLEKIRPG